MFPSDKGLTLETSASEILTEANLCYQLINNTKLPQSKSLPDIMERRPHWKFFCSKTPCSHFHSCVKEFCVVPPWTKASKRYESFHQSVITIFICVWVDSPFVRVKIRFFIISTQRSNIQTDRNFSIYYFWECIENTGN